MEWKLNNPVNGKLVIGAAWYHFKSALTEELVFRGALLYILIKKLGMQKALFLSAIAFGVYHWFSFGMFGAGIIPMVYVFITTGFMGYVWGYGFAKTRSIMMPLGFHLGWNLLSAFFYPAQPYGQLIFTGTSNAVISDLDGSLFSILSGLFPSVVTLLFVKWQVKSSFVSIER